jgi:hypothetical protein
LKPPVIHAQSSAARANRRRLVALLENVARLTDGLARRTASRARGAGDRPGNSRSVAGRIRFDFRGKHGTEHHIDLRDKRLAAIVRRCQELPGQELFQYLDEEGAPHSVSSEEQRRAAP